MIEKKLFYEINKKADFHSVVMTTFSFDFHHFETQVLKQIKQKGVTNVCLFADETMLDESIGFATGNLKSISSSYSINSIASKGVFHPKLSLFVGDREVMLLQGSGNITSGGHGKNHELFSVLYATEDDTSQLPLIIETWEYIKSLTTNVKGMSSEKLNWIESHSTLLTKPKNEKHRFHKLSHDFEVALLYNEKTGILNQLKNLIPKENVKRIKVISPFYDENGALLMALSNHYGECSIEAYFQENKGIHPHNMEKQKNVRFYSWDGTERAEKTFKKYERKLHAKLFLFETNEWNYCLMGSANATIAAFGNDNYSGANDEFSVLYKYKNRNLEEELGIIGNKQKLTPTKPNETEEKNATETALTRIQKIKILGADKDGRTITLYLQNFNQHKKIKSIFYDYWGALIEEQFITNPLEKIKLELSKTTLPNGVAFIQLFDEYDTPISNKQLLNNVSDLWNTNPSPENRRIMRLTSIIESGDSKLFDVMEYFNTLHSSRTSVIKSSVSNSNGSEKGEKPTKDIDNVITYEEAIALDTNTKSHQRILKQHHSIKIWDSFEKYTKEYTQEVEEGNMDDEEEGDATSSRDRKEPVKDKKPEIYNSLAVLEKRREIICKFLKNYFIALIKVEKIENKKIGLVDLAMLLIVMKQLQEVTHRKFILKNEINDKNTSKYIYEIDGNLSEIRSFSGAVLNLLGQFITIALKSTWEKPEDEYTEKKLNHYKNISCITSLFSIAIIKKSYSDNLRFTDWFDVTSYNILKIFGKPTEGFESIIENLISDSHIEELSNTEINKIIRSWIAIYENKQYLPNYFENETTGICLIRRFIPNDAPKFLKLSRPGFDYDEQEHDFIFSELFNLETAQWIKSKNSLKK
jgi:hypothetical protein